MKKIFYLIKLEFKRLQKTVILTALILVLFMGMLFGVVSVSSGLMSNVCNHLNDTNSAFYCFVDNATFEMVGEKFYRQIIYSMDNSFVSAPIKTPNGKEFNMTQNIINDDGKLSSYDFSGRILYVNEALKSILQENNNRITGNWIQDSNEICLSRYVADALGISLNESIIINEHELLVVGIYDWEDNDELSYGLSYAFIATLDNQEELNSICVKFDSSSEMFAAYQVIEKMNPDAYCMYYDFFENINHIQSAIAAIVIILAIVIIIALYSMVSLLFRQRKIYVCTLKTLGALDENLMFVYCGLITVILIVAVGISTVLGILFNIYLMHICETVLGFVFVTNFNYYTPLITICALSLITFLLWYIINTKMKTQLVAEAIRHE